MTCNKLQEILTGNSIIIDVRSELEFLQYSIRGAINVPLSSIHNFAETATSFDNIVVYCQSGSRSALAQNILQSCGLTNVTNIGSIMTYRDCIS